MAWYKTGTVAVTNGQTAVTGTGTKFATNARVGDGFNGPDGNWYEVTNIASETVIAIFPAYQGTTESSSSNYMIAPLQGYNKESADRLRAITDSLTVVTSVAGKTGNVILNSSDVGLSNVDNTSDLEKPLSTAALNEINQLKTGKKDNFTILPVNQGGTGGVTAQEARVGISAAKSGDNSDITSITGLTTALSVAQGGTGVKSTPALLTSLESSGAYSKANIVGAVSQSGGVPTGAIVESGSNASGQYTKWADGTYHATRTETIVQALNSTIGGLFWRGTSDVPPLGLPSSNFTRIDSCNCISGGEYPTIVGCVTPAGVGNFGIWRQYSPVALPLATYTAKYEIWGRWY